MEDIELFPEKADSQGVVDLKLFPFVDNTIFNDSIIREERLTLKPTTNTNPVFSFQLPIQNGTFYDLRSSFFEFLVKSSYTVSGTTYNFNPSDWTPPNAFEYYCFPSMYHSFMRIGNFQLQIQNQTVSDTYDTSYAYAFKEFANTLLNTPHKNVTSSLESYTLNNQWCYNFDSDDNFGMTSGVVSPKTITTYAPSGSLRNVIGGNSWASCIRSYLASYYSGTCVWESIFYPNDSVWRNKYYFPSMCNIQVNFSLQSNINFFYQTAAIGTEPVPSEAVQNINLQLRVLRLSSKGLYYYNTMFVEAKLLKYFIRHSQTFSYPLPSGSNFFYQSGFSPSKKPQVLIIHIAPSPAEKTDINYSHAFSNFGSTLAPISPISTAFVTFGSTRFPQTYVYDKNDYNQLDYNEYVRLCTVKSDGLETVERTPFLTEVAWNSKQWCLLVFNLQNNGDIFDQKIQTDLDFGTIGININFTYATTADCIVYITCLVNENFTITQSYDLTKSYT